MTNHLTAIIKEISDDYRLDIKRVDIRKIEIEGYHSAYGTNHAYMLYRVRKAGKIIKMDYDIDRAIARDVLVFDAT